jgi:glycosyltransferase involved in cell wall biosynthesis
MNILVLGKYYPPYCGGIETLTRNWCEGFVRLGGQVRCVVANDRPTTVRESLAGVQVERHARHGTPLSTPLCPGYLRAARRPADVIQLHFPNPLADLTMLLGRRSVPLVITYHSDIVRQKSVMSLYRPLLHWLLRRAARIVVATPPQLEHSAVLPRFRDRCEVIPFGLDLARFEAVPAPAPEVAAARAAAGPRAVLLNIGRLVGYKGQRYLIEALRHLDAVAWLVGTGPLRTELEQLAAATGVADRVRFWGEVEDGLLPALLHASDVFVLSSITPNEAFGLVQVEAMACRKPVISCQLPSGVPYVNQDGLTGFVVPPADAAALAAAAKKLCADPGLRATMGGAGLARARAEFSLETMVGRYWRLFERLAGDPKRA